MQNALEIKNWGLQTGRKMTIYILMVKKRYSLANQIGA